MKLRDFFNAAPKPKPMATDTQMESIKYVKRPPSFVERDVKSLKNAYKAATSISYQQRATLYDIYFENLVLDAHLRGITEKRTLSVINQDLVYMDKSGEVFDIGLIGHPRFLDMLRDVFETIYWGYSVLDIDTKSGEFDYFIVPRKHVNPESNTINPDEYGNNGINIDLFQNGLKVGRYDDMGLFMVAGVYSIFKRNMLADWAQYSEKAAMMLNMIKGTGNDKLVEKALIDTYSQLGSNPSVTIPDGVDMDFMNMSSSSQNQLFEGFFDTLNAEQSKLILGQTMTTEDGSSLSQSEVHAAQQHILLNADKRYVLNFLNYKFNKFMPMFGAPEGGYFKFVESDSLSLSEQLDNDLKLQQLGVVFDEKYLREKYGIDD